MYKKLLEFFKDNEQALRLIKSYKKHKDSKIDELEMDLEQLITQTTTLQTQFIKQLELLTYKSKQENTVVPVNVEIDKYEQQKKERSILKQRIITDITKQEPYAVIEGLKQSFLELSARQSQVHFNEIEKINKDMNNVEEMIKKYLDESTS